MRGDVEAEYAPVRHGVDYKASAPLWVLAALLAAYPTIAFVRGPMRRWRRRRKGLCIECGYDLTGNVSGVCPECGNKTTANRDVDEGAFS